MSEGRWAVSVTLKGGQGFESPWIVLGADTPADMITLIGDLADTGLEAAVRLAADKFRVVATGSPEAAAEAILGGTPVPATPTPQPVQQLPQGLAPPCPTCNWPTEYRTQGTSDGWKGYFCTNPASRNANPKHKVTWVR